MPFEVDVDWVERDRARVRAEERQRCLRIIATTEPPTAGLSGMALQMRTGHDWMLALRAAISTAIAQPE